MSEESVGSLSESSEWWWVGVGVRRGEVECRPYRRLGGRTVSQPDGAMVDMAILLGDEDDDDALEPESAAEAGGSISMEDGEGGRGFGSERGLSGERGLKYIWWAVVDFAGQT